MLLSRIWDSSVSWFMSYLCRICVYMLQSRKKCSSVSTPYPHLHKRSSTGTFGLFWRPSSICKLWLMIRIRAVWCTLYVGAYVVYTACLFYDFRYLMIHISETSTLFLVSFSGYFLPCMCLQTNLLPKVGSIWFLTQMNLFKKCNSQIWHILSNFAVFSDF